MSAVLESDCLDFLLKDSRSKAAAVASGSWFHNRIVDGKNNNAEPPELGHTPATPFENQGDYDAPDN
jgi:hypothetical protein